MSDQDQQDKTPDEIREDIEQTRSNLGDTVEALGAKSDVKGRASARVEEIKGNVKESVSGAADSVKSASPSSAQQGGAAAADKVKQNPLPFAIAGALIIGFLIGRARNA